MNQEPPQRPITYGDLFDAQGELASEPVTKEDASMMQSAEARVVGQTKRGGLASMMQSAAERNLQTGAIDEDTCSIVASEGVSVVEMIVPGGVVDTEYVAGQPILQEVRSVPTVTVRDAITIGKPLEAAEIDSYNKPLEEIDARAIQSAEARPAGSPMKGGFGSDAPGGDYRGTGTGISFTEASTMGYGGGTHATGHGNMSGVTGGFLDPSAVSYGGGVTAAGYGVGHGDIGGTTGVTGYGGMPGMGHGGGADNLATDFEQKRDGLFE